MTRWVEQRGPDDDFLRLVAPHRDAVRLHCYRMLGSTNDSDDVLQETLVRAWERASLRRALPTSSTVFALTAPLVGDVEQKRTAKRYDAQVTIA